MSDVTARARITHSRLQIAVLALAAILLLTVTVATSTSLYFVWEEWGHLWDAVESPFWGLLQSHFGYVTPLGRLAFLIEAKVFGHWYTGYVLVNALLMIAVVALMWRTLRPVNTWASWALTGGLVVFLFSGGSLYAVHFAAMNSYLLCWLFGMLALRAWRRNSRPVIVLLFLTAALLSNTLMNVVVAAFVIPAMVALGRGGSEPEWSWRRVRGPIGYTVFSLVGSFILYLVGRSFPSVDPLVGVQQSLANGPSASMLAQALPLLAQLAVWLIAPFVGLVTLDQDLYQRAVILFIDVPILAIAALAFVVVISGAVFATRWGGVGWRRGALALLLLTSAVGFAVQVTLFRGDQSFQIRYSLMWLPSIVVFWSRLIELAQPTVLRHLARAGTVIMLGAAAVVATFAPMLVGQVVDLMRPRTELSLELKQAVAQCGEIAEPEVADVLAPGMPWDAVCDSARFLGR